MTGLGLGNTFRWREREFGLSPFGHLGKNVTAKILGEANSQNLIKDEKNRKNSFPSVENFY